MKRSWMMAALLVVATAVTGPRSLFAHTPSQAPAQAPDPLIEELRSAHADVRAKAAKKIGKRGDPSYVPLLAAALSDPVLKVRREVILALAQIRTPESLLALASAARDADPDVRHLAVRSVIGYYTGETPSTGFKAFLKGSWEHTGGRIGEEDIQIDPGVYVQPKVVAALLDALKDENSIRAARESAKGLGILAARSAVPQLVQSAHSTDEKLARESLGALVKIKDTSAGPSLMDLLDSPDEDVKRDAAVTLGILRARDALPKLQALFENDPSRKTREKGLEGLAYLGNPVSVPLFIRTLWSDNKRLRTSAAEGLGRAGDPKGLPELEKALPVERDAKIRVTMQYAITSLGKNDYLSTLVGTLGSRRLGETAQAYLVELSQNPKFLPRLYPYLLSRDADVRARLCTVLMYTGDKTSWEHLERLSHDPHADVAAEALRAMRAIRSREVRLASQPPAKANP